MKLTVLGNNGPYPGVEGACSGYLIEHNDARILLDCGSGVLGRLQKFCNIESLTHIMLSHLHYDHTSDIMALRYAVEGKRKRGKTVNPIKLYLPDEPEEEYEKITSKDVFSVCPISEELKLIVDNLKISFARMNHQVKCFATKIELDDKVFVYSGDTGVTPVITQFAKNADLFLCDAGLLSKDKAENAPHLTAYEVGVVAKDAGVKRLLLTHFWPEDDTSRHLAEARESYPQAELAELGISYQV